MLVSAIVIWALEAFSPQLTMVSDPADSTLALVANWLTPIFAPLGLADWRIAVALIAGFAFGPATGAVVSVIPYLVHIATTSGVYGMVMAILATFALVMPASLIYRRQRTMRGAIIGLVTGGIVCLAACIVGNLIVTPFYTGMPVDAVAALIVPALLPFNIIKIATNCIVFVLIMRPVFKAMGVDAPAANTAGDAC